MGQISVTTWAPFLSVEIDSNWLTGTIPSELGLLSDMNYFFATHNQLSGSIPDEVAMLITNGKLKAFDVAFNDGLEGSLSEINELCFVNSTYFDVDCWLGSGFETPYYCGCECACYPHNATNVTGDYL